MWRAYFLIVMFCMPFAHANSITHERQWVRDWRLERPFVHGFLGVMTVNTIPLFPDKWHTAYRFEHNALAPGAVAVLERNKSVPFFAGIIAGGLTWAFFMGGAIRCYRNRFIVDAYKRHITSHNETEKC